jgi:plastocyanin
MANDWYGDEWGSPGWTAQQPSTVAGPETPATSLPPNFAAVTVTAKYVDDQGDALNGSMVRFRPSVSRVTDGDTVVWLHEVHTRIDKGVLSIDLLATDVAGVTPAFTWHVKECFPGGEEYNVTLPSATVSPVSLFSLPQA